MPLTLLLTLPQPAGVPESHELGQPPPSNPLPPHRLRGGSASSRLEERQAKGPRSILLNNHKFSGATPRGIIAKESFVPARKHRRCLNRQKRCCYVWYCSKIFPPGVGGGDRRRSRNKSQQNTAHHRSLRPMSARIYCFMMYCCTYIKYIGATRSGGTKARTTQGQTGRRRKG